MLIVVFLCCCWNLPAPVSAYYNYTWEYANYTWPTVATNQTKFPDKDCNIHGWGSFFDPLRNATEVPTLEICVEICNVEPLCKRVNYFPPEYNPPDRKGE